MVIVMVMEADGIAVHILVRVEEEGNPTERKHRLSRRLLTREQHNASTAARPANGVQRKSCARAQ